MAFWCYMLRCADGKYYTGHTDDLDRRIGQHRTGGYCAFTSRRLPVELVWSEYFPTRVEALEAERIVGGWSRAKKEALIAGDWKRVGYFARPPRERVSTTLDTNGGGGTPSMSSTPHPFASSEVEKRDGAGTRARKEITAPTPFVSSPVERRGPDATPV